MCTSSNLIFAAETVKAAVGGINLNLGAGSENYYFISATGNWITSDSGCSNPRYAMISVNHTMSSAVLSVALTSKSTQQKISFVGTCPIDKNKMEITYIYFQE